MARRLNNNRKIVLIAVDLRSTHNVGSLFRTAEGLGVNELILAGYSPYPKADKEDRLPHLANKLDKQIAKTALGSEKLLSWRLSQDLKVDLVNLKKQGFIVYGLEQNDKSIDIMSLKATEKVVIIVGNEVSGLDEATVRLCDELVEIPMLGKKESFNVVQAAAMALFYLRST